MIDERLACLPELKLTYCTRYNGWSVDWYVENETIESPGFKLTRVAIECELPNITIYGCDEDGEYEYDELTEEHYKEVEKLIKKHAGDAEFYIEYDHYSS